MRAASLHALVDLVAPHLLQLQPERHVVEDRHVRVERVVLEDHGDVALLGRHVVHDAAADADRALRDHLEPGDHAQRRRLAAPRRADEDDELLVLDGEIEGADRLGAVRGTPCRRRRARSRSSTVLNVAVVTSLPPSSPGYPRWRCGRGPYDELERAARRTSATTGFVGVQGARGADPSPS